MTTLAKIAAPALAALVLAAASPARAQSGDDHVARAHRFYDLQDWPHALAEYRQAYATDPKPETLWAIAQVQRLSGDCRGAVLSYEAFMRGASDSAALAARGLIAKCRETLAEQRRAATAARAASTPTPHAAHAASTPPPPAAHAAPRPERPAPWILDPFGDVLGVASVGALTTGVVFLALGNLAMAATSEAGSYQTYDHDVAVARTQQQIGVGLTIGGAVLAGLAVWRFAVVAHHGAKREAVSLTVTPTPGGAFTACSVRF
jgi:hypothetical protein